MIKKVFDFDHKNTQRLLTIQVVYKLDFKLWIFWRVLVRKFYIYIARIVKNDLCKYDSF